MATIEIRDVLDNETGQTIFPRTHVNAVIGLKDSNFFEAVSDGNGGYSVKLKSEYIGLWAEGWISAGGVGSGSGGGSGGLITSVRSIDDLGTPIQTESLTETFSAKAIESIFEELGDFGVSLSLSRVASYFKDANGNYFLDANGNRIVVGGAGSSSLSLLNKSGRVLSSVELDLDMSNYASKSWVSQNFLTQETDPTVPSWAKATNPPSYSFGDLTEHPTTLGGYGITDGVTSDALLAVSGRVDAIEGWFEVVTVNGESALHAKSGMAIYSDSWISAGGIGSGSGGGGSVVSISNVKTVGTKIADITIDGVTTAIKDGLVWGAYNDTAKTVALTLNGQQYVLCVNGYSAGGGVSSESDPVFTASPAYGITSNDISAWNAKSDFSGAYSDLTGKPSFYALSLNSGSFVSGTYDPTSGAGSFNIPTTLDHIADGSTRRLANYLPLSGGTMTGDIVMNGANVVPASNNMGSIGTSPYRFGDFYGVDADLSGDLTLSSSSHLDIGPLRLQFENNALHITKKTSSDTTAYGLYADGFVAAGGIGSASGGGTFVKYVACNNQAEYNEISTKDPATIYTIGDPVGKIYMGSILLYQES